MFCDELQRFSFRETFSNREPAIVIGKAVPQQQFRPCGIEGIREAAAHQIAHDALFAADANDLLETLSDLGRAEMVEEVIRKDKVPWSRGGVG